MLNPSPPCSCLSFLYRNLCMRSLLLELLRRRWIWSHCPSSVLFSPNELPSFYPDVQQCFPDQVNMELPYTAAISSPSLPNFLMAQWLHSGWYITGSDRKSKLKNIQTKKQRQFYRVFNMIVTSLAEQCHNIKIVYQ